MNPTRLLIVGGGSAGWMAAAYLEAALNHGERRTVEISVVESPDVPRIGVGEATIPHINHILDVIGIARREFLRRVDGTFFKIGFVSTNPQTAAMVTNRLADLFVRENAVDRENAAKTTAAFIESQLNEARTKLEEHEA